MKVDFVPALQSKDFGGGAELMKCQKIKEL